MSKLGRFEQRVVRGKILKVLDLNYPHKTNPHILWMAVCESGYDVAEAEIGMHLTYLSDKGYVEIIEIPNTISGKDEPVAQLTPKGKDLVDEYIPADPGVCLR